MVTEVTITEGGAPTSYAQHCPTDLDLTQFLGKIVEGVVLAPHSQRVFIVPGTALEIDRANVTSVVITQNAN